MAVAGTSWDQQLTQTQMRDWLLWACRETRIPADVAARPDAPAWASRYWCKDREKSHARHMQRQRMAHFLYHNAYPPANRSAFYEQIAQMMGWRSHTSVIEAITKHQTRIEGMIQRAANEGP